MQPINLAGTLESSQTGHKCLEDKGAMETPFIFLWARVRLDQSCGRNHLLWDHHHWNSYIENENVRGNTNSSLQSCTRTRNVSNLEIYLQSLQMHLNHSSKSDRT